MARAKLILDIRHYESDQENVDYSSMPDEPGNLYPFPSSIHAIGARIARKLREYGFITGDFDHVYINYTPLLADDAVRLSPRDGEKWLRYFDYGLQPKNVRKLTKSQREAFVTDSTFRVLRFLCHGDKARQPLLARVQKEVVAADEKLEIVHKVKETATYRVAVTYLIAPHPKPAVGLIDYQDKRSGAHGKKPFIQLRFYEDIFPLVGSISVAKGMIRLNPRSSFKASLDTRRYRVPIEVPIHDLVSLGNAP